MTRITAAALVLAASSVLAAGATIVDWVATGATTNGQEGEARLDRIAGICRAGRGSRTAASRAAAQSSGTNWIGTAYGCVYNPTW